MFEKQASAFDVTMAILLFGIVYAARAAPKFDESKPSRWY